jgi:hypothetical protein
MNQGLSGSILSPPHVNLSTKELVALGQKKDASLDTLILAHQMAFIQSVPEAPAYFLANIPWKQVQGFFLSLHNQLLDDLAGA